MQPTVTDRVVWSVGRSVTIVSPAKTAKPIHMPFGLWTQIGQRKHVLHCVEHWRNLVNTIEPSVCGGVWHFCQITLTLVTV